MDSDSLFSQQLATLVPLSFFLASLAMWFIAQYVKKGAVENASSTKNTASSHTPIVEAPSVDTISAEATQDSTPVVSADLAKLKKEEALDADEQKKDGADDVEIKDTQPKEVIAVDKENADVDNKNGSTGEKKDEKPEDNQNVEEKKSNKKEERKKSTKKDGDSKHLLTLGANFKIPVPAIYLNGVSKDIGLGRGDQQQQGGIWLSAKIYIPEVKNYNFIGRILGPRGISVRRLEAETGCKILIRGQGSIKDEKREQSLMNRSGWAHLRDKLHVLILANGEEEVLCRERLQGAVQVIQRLLTPQYDEYKRQQLVHLAILNGTYRP